MNSILKPDYLTARRIMLDYTGPVGTERLALSLCWDRVLAEEITADYDIPPFDRSAYDGYAVRAEDSREASGHGAALQVTEEVFAGSVPSLSCLRGTAVKIHTGAPIPEGADAVVKFEDTSFSDKKVELTYPVKSGENIVRAGEDIRRGVLIAEKGHKMDTGVIGVLASQGISDALVYRKPVVGVVSTGGELTETGKPLPEGMIYDSNRYMLTAVLLAAGCIPLYLGHADDEAEETERLFAKGISECDAVISTGGVSVGERDLVPAVMERLGIDILVRGMKLKPGMGCAFGGKDGKPVFALSGNPASAFTAFHAVAAPSMRRLAGLCSAEPKEILVTLQSDYPKRSPVTRLLRGRLDLSDGSAKLFVPKSQGNAVLTSAIGCDAMAVVPAGSGPVAAGTVLHGFIL